MKFGKLDNSHNVFIIKFLLEANSKHVYENCDISKSKKTGSVKNKYSIRR